MKSFSEVFKKLNRRFPNQMWVDKLECQLRHIGVYWNGTIDSTNKTVKNFLEKAKRGSRNEIYRAIKKAIYENAVPINRGYNPFGTGH